MSKSIFNYNCYKTYIRDWVQAHPKKGRGLYSKMASCTGIQPVIISQTLSGSRDFSLDQAYLISEFMGIEEGLEWDYLTTLVYKERAATDKLKKSLIRKATALKKQNQMVGERFRDKARLAEFQSKIFFSDVDFSLTRAVIAISTGIFDDVISRLSELGITQTKANYCLKELEEIGLIAKKDDQYIILEKGIHIDKESPYYKIFKESVSNLVKSRFGQRFKEDALNYQSLATLSKEAATVLRSDMLQFLKESSKKIADSRSEEIYVLNLDFVRLQ